MDDRSPPATEYRFLDWRYEPARRRLVGPAGEVRLKPLSDRLLRHLLDAPGAVLSREHLIEEVWTRREVNDEVLSRAIAELRALLGDDARAAALCRNAFQGRLSLDRAGGARHRRAAGARRPASVATMDRGGLGAALVLMLLGVWLLGSARGDRRWRRFGDAGRCACSPRARWRPIRGSSTTRGSTAPGTSFMCAPIRTATAASSC